MPLGIRMSTNDAAATKKSFYSSNIIQGANIPCHFGTYDLNSDGEISLKEFLIATRGFTKMDPTTLFVRLDTNGKGIA